MKTIKKNSISMKSNLKLQFGAVALIILVVALLRVLHHFPNYSPLGALCLFGAAHFANRKYAYIIPIFAVWLSDLVLNNVIYSEYFTSFSLLYPGFYWQYGSYLLTVVLGQFLFKKVSVLRVLGGALAASILFFVISNFGVWAGGTMYPKTFNGLVACYVAGIPFIKGTLLGNFIFSGALFGGYYLLQRNFTAFKLPNIVYK